MPNMQDEIAYEQPTQEEQDQFIRDMGTNREQIRKDVAWLKSWLASDPILPAVQDEQFLERFHAHCKFDLEKTQKKLAIYYTTRTLEPEILRDRDPLDPVIRRSKDVAFHLTLPRLTPADRQRVTILRLWSTDPTHLDMEVVIKAALMMLDVHISKDYAYGHILVVDGKDFSATHLCKLTPTFMKKADTCSTKAFPLRYSSVHFLNIKPFMQTTMNIFKAFLGPKMSSRLIIHSDIETFYEHVPKEILPKEYGGTYKYSAIEIRDEGYRKMVEEREWFLEQQRIFAELENKKDSFNDIFGSKGTFRTIQID